MKYLVAVCALFFQGCFMMPMGGYTNQGSFRNESAKDDSSIQRLNAEYAPSLLNLSVSGEGNSIDLKELEKAVAAMQSQNTINKGAQD
jgi:hypothetical protein